MQIRIGGRRRAWWPALASASDLLRQGCPAGAPRPSPVRRVRNVRAACEVYSHCPFDGREIRGDRQDAGKGDRPHFVERRRQLCEMRSRRFLGAGRGFGELCICGTLPREVKLPVCVDKAVGVSEGLHVAFSVSISEVGKTFVDLPPSIGSLAELGDRLAGERTRVPFSLCFAAERENIEFSGRTPSTRLHETCAQSTRNSVILMKSDTFCVIMRRRHELVSDCSIKKSASQALLNAVKLCHDICNDPLRSPSPLSIRS